MRNLNTNDFIAWWGRENNHFFLKSGDIMPDDDQDLFPVPPETELNCND